MGLVSSYLHSLLPKASIQSHLNFSSLVLPMSLLNKKGSTVVPKLSTSFSFYPTKASPTGEASQLPTFSVSDQVSPRNLPTSLLSIVCVSLSLSLSLCVSFSLCVSLSLCFSLYVCLSLVSLSLFLSIRPKPSLSLYDLTKRLRPANPTRPRVSYQRSPHTTTSSEASLSLYDPTGEALVSLSLVCVSL